MAKSNKGSKVQGLTSIEFKSFPRRVQTEFTEKEASTLFCLARFGLMYMREYEFDALDPIPRECDLDAELSVLCLKSSPENRLVRCICGEGESDSDFKKCLIDETRRGWMCRYCGKKMEAQ